MIRSNTTGSLTRILHDGGPQSTAGFTCGVSLHGHTLVSREGMQFIPRVARGIPALKMAIDQAVRNRGCAGMDAVDWSRVWWTPPVTPHQAMDLESAQIRGLGLRPMVSLTDHDSIAAPMALTAIEEWAESVPVSTEWTFPFRGTFFHIGVHNLPRDRANAIFAALAAATRSGDETKLLAALRMVRNLDETLIVLNHPMWDEKGVGKGLHRQRLDELICRAGACFDALELNGMRPRAENDDVVAYAALRDFPVISGGDRHGHEPNSCLNLTNAATFAEFANEVRHRRISTVLLMRHHLQHLAFRVINHLWEILRDDPEHGLGWMRWDERVFYRCDDGQEHTLRSMWNDRPPFIVLAFVGMVKLMGNATVRNAVRAALPARQEPGI